MILKKSYNLMKCHAIYGCVSGHKKKDVKNE